MKEKDISRRHRILIAAAAAAVLGPRARIREIAPVTNHAPKPRLAVQVHIRTARREEIHEIAHLA
jgi:hypothetical protein